MVVMRRLLLFVFVLAAPVAMVAAIYLLSLYGLEVTHRTMAPRILYYSAFVEYAVFLVAALLEAKNRW